MTKRHTTEIGPLLVDEPDLSRAWAKAVLHVVEHTGPEISPLILSVTGFDDRGVPTETQAVRSALDALLLVKGGTCRIQNCRSLELTRCLKFKHFA